MELTHYVAGQHKVPVPGKQHVCIYQIFIEGYETIHQKIIFELPPPILSLGVVEEHKKTRKALEAKNNQSFDFGLAFGVEEKEVVAA
jgi:hypothetical protein